MFIERKKIKKRFYILCFVAFAFGVCIGIEFFSGRNSMKISSKGVSKIIINIEPNAYEGISNGSATIDDEQSIKNVVDVLNGIRIRRGNYSLDGLARDELCTTITFLKGNEIINEVYFYSDLVFSNGECYGISIYQNDKLINLCERYGDVMYWQ